MNKSGSKNVEREGNEGFVGGSGVWGGRPQRVWLSIAETPPSESILPSTSIKLLLYCLAFIYKVHLFLPVK